MHLHYLNEFSYIYLALYLIKLINIIEYLYSTCSKEIQLRLWPEKETIVYLSFLLKPQTFSYISSLLNNSLCCYIKALDVEKLSSVLSVKHTIVLKTSSSLLYLGRTAAFSVTLMEELRGNSDQKRRIPDSFLGSDIAKISFHKYPCPI